MWIINHNHLNWCLHNNCDSTLKFLVPMKLFFYQAWWLLESTKHLKNKFLRKHFLHISYYILVIIEAKYFLNLFTSCKRSERRTSLVLVNCFLLPPIISIRNALQCLNEFLWKPRYLAIKWCNMQGRIQGVAHVAIATCSTTSRKKIYIYISTFSFLVHTIAKKNLLL